jgi:hypothetical protein
VDEYRWHLHHAFAGLAVAGGPYPRLLSLRPPHQIQPAVASSRPDHADQLVQELQTLGQQVQGQGDFLAAQKDLTEALHTILNRHERQIHALLRAVQSVAEHVQELENYLGFSPPSQRPTIRLLRPDDAEPDDAAAAPTAPEEMESDA